MAERWDRKARRAWNSEWSRDVFCEECGKTLDYVKGSIRWGCVESGSREHLCPGCAGRLAADRVFEKVKSRLAGA